MLNSGITILVYVLSESFVEVHEHDTFCIKWKGPGKNPSPRWDSVFSLSFHLTQQRIMLSYVLLVKN